MAPYFKEIYLMAESPALAGVNAVLNEQTQLPLRYKINPYGIPGFYCNCQ